MPQTSEHGPVLTLDQLATLIAEMRKPPVDPVKEAQKKRELRIKEEGHRSRWRAAIERLLRCAHSRQDGTCVIGWAKQSDGIERGVCPHCCSNGEISITPEVKSFAEIVDELFPEKSKEVRETMKSELRQLYDKQRTRPRGLMESVRYVA